VSRRAAKIGLVLLLGAAVVAIYLSPLREHLNKEDIRTAVGQLRGLWYGPVVFITVFAVACVVAVPASVFVLAAGLIWGWFWGGTWSLIGGMIGALASFFAGRFLGEGVLHRFGRLGRLVARQVDHAGFKSLLIIRFIPGIPFALVNYGAGVCGVLLLDFLLATILGMAPSVYIFAYFADALFNGTMSEGAAVVRLLIAAALLIALVLGGSALARGRAPAVTAKDEGLTSKD
jgi:uncharacterized membrane protein YdjX (TVP38/TMEM64 family)